MKATSKATGGARAPGGRAARWTLALLVALALLAQVFAAFRTGIHWDEFAQLHVADWTLAHGEFESGGRPGLGTLILLPFVADCDDEIEVAQRARLLWVAITAAFLAGVWMCLIELTGHWQDAALAVALLALVPAFLDSSVQIRTDQIALAGGAWGAVGLLASRRHPALAALAGLAFGVGMLGSQKVIYLGALAGLLAAGQLWLARQFELRREALRLTLCSLACALVLAGFGLALRLAFTLPELAASQAPVGKAVVSGGLSLFEFYRQTIGWSQYAEMLPTLAAHGLLLVALAVTTVYGGGAQRRRLTLAWAVLALGLAVGLFHAAAFSYFWMTLGLFPAVGLALARGPIVEAAASLTKRTRVLAFTGFALLLALPASLALAGRSLDAQSVQRESLHFVHRNFEPSAAGFQPERALFCQDGAQPGLTWFSRQIHSQFGRDPQQRAHLTRLLLDEFRDTPILFLVQSFRLDQFPAEVRRFWSENYQPYRASVFVAGRRLSGAGGERSDFELVAPGRYRWLPFSSPNSVAIDGRLLRPGEVLRFEPGPHEAYFLEDVEGGLLVLALEEPPGEAPLRFYP